MTPSALTPEKPILLVDDEPAWLRSLGLALERSAGLAHLVTCSDPRAVMELLARQEVSLILLDLNMPYISGEELLTRITADFPEIPVIVLTGINQVETAVKCMRAGAFDFFVKTSEEERLVAGVLRALEVRGLREQNRLLRRSLMTDALNHPDAFAPLITQAPRMLALFRYIEAVAPSTEPVLITGESGTGKELAARAVHAVGRPNAPWMAINVAGLDDQHFADTLFGHVKGAFTGADRNRAGMVEQAEGGTLFLDEIGDLSPASQIKLLRLLQEREYHPLGSDRPKRANIRIVAATSHDLVARQNAGEFRRDLYYRLCAHQVYLPPLRERPGDFPLLLDHFFEEAARVFHRRKPTWPKELCTLLETHHFPGNHRELRSMVFDAMSTHTSGQLSTASFRRAMGLSDAKDHISPQGRDPVAAEMTFPERLPTLEEAGRILVEEAMRRAQGNQTLAARLLGITRPGLSKRLQKYASSEEDD